MPRLEARRRIEQAAEWTARHRLVGPLGWGFVVVGALLVPSLVAIALANVADGTTNAALGAIATLIALALRLTLLPFFVGTSVPGYIVGRSGVSQTGLLLPVGVMVAPFVVPFALLVNTYGGGAVGIFVVAPIFLIPFAIGYRRGRRAQPRDRVV